MVTTVREDQTRNSRRNAIINGDLNIWQRGTSFVAAPAFIYVADRWLYAKSGSMVHTVSRSTDFPTVAQSGRLFNFSLELALTTPDTAIAVSDRVEIQQRIEGFNFVPLAQQAMVLSFWVRAGVTGIYCVSFVNSGVDRSFVAEYTIGVANTWEYKTILIPASPSAGTWNYQNGIGIAVRWALAAGTTFQTTPGTWQTGNFLATSNQVNGVNTGAGIFRVTGVQLERGSTPSLLEYRPFSEELQLCQRYYQKTYDLATPPATATIIASLDCIVSGVFIGNVLSISVLPVAMRSTPVATIYNPATGAIGSFDLASTPVPATGVAAENSVSIQSIGASTDGAEHTIHYTVDAEL